MTTPEKRNISRVCDEIKQGRLMWAESSAYDLAWAIAKEFKLTLPETSKIERLASALEEFLL